MSKWPVRKALLWALVITVVSCVLLTLVHGMPTGQQLVEDGMKMFAGAFFVFLYLFVRGKA